MITDYHILNGDALKDRFPKEINGEVIVVRECLVDGEMNSRDLKELFRIRARFISTIYSKYSSMNEFHAYSEQDYYRDTVSEFEKISDIPEGANVHLWFEDDLFCQVNFWFVASLLKKTAENGSAINLVRPGKHTRYGFGGLSQDELLSIYQDRIRLREIDKIASLWSFYQSEDTTALISTARELKEKHPYILAAVEAHLERIPKANDPGRPIRSLLSIMKEFQTEDFATIFKEFCKREYIYGFGDVQVRRLLDHLAQWG